MQYSVADIFSRMQGTPWSDGTPGVTQKPIEVGESFIYRFKAYPSGTHWYEPLYLILLEHLQFLAENSPKRYHSHSRLTLLDGLYGAILIRCDDTMSVF